MDYVQLIAVLVAILVPMIVAARMGAHTDRGMRTGAPDLLTVPETRQLEDLAFLAPAAGQTRVRAMERGKPVRAMRVRVLATINVAVLGAPVFQEDAPFNLFDIIRIRRTGGDAIVETTGEHLEFLKTYESGTPSFSLLPTLVVGDNILEWDASIPFYPENTPFRRKWALMLPWDGEDHIEFVLAAVADLFTTPPTTFTLTNVTIEVTQEEEGGDAARIFSADGVGLPLVRYMVTTTDDLAAGGANRTPIPRNNIAAGGDLTSVLFLSRAGTPLVRDDDHLTRTVLKWRNRTLLDEQWTTLRRLQKRWSVLETPLAGVVYYPIDQENDLAGRIPLSGVTGTRFEFDHTVATAPVLHLLRSEVYKQPLALGRIR